MTVTHSSLDNPAAVGPRSLDRFAAVFVVLAAAAAVMWLASVRNGILFLLGAGLGISLLAFGIGFAGPWRNFVVRREARGLVATLLLLGIAGTLFIPALASLSNTVPNIGQVGLSLLVGSFLFGIGMQLGGGCGSGTLVGAGSGSRHSLLVFLFFMPGSVIGSLHLPWWLSTPNIGRVDLGAALGVGGAVLLQIVVLAFIALCAVLIARKNGNHAWRPTGRQAIGCVVIVLLALTVLFISGRMWSITFGYALWGAKLVDAAGVDIGSTQYWSTPFLAEALERSVLADVTSVMNFGLLAGVAALTLWRTDNSANAPWQIGPTMAAVVAGLLMGYGARLAFGCNIGALFSGVASGSLHAWLWFAAAWAGSHAGIMLRPRFGMAN